MTVHRSTTSARLSGPWVPATSMKPVSRGSTPGPTAVGRLIAGLVDPTGRAPRRTSSIPRTEVGCGSPKNRTKASTNAACAVGRDTLTASAITR